MPSERSRYRTIGGVLNLVGGITILLFALPMSVMGLQLAKLGGSKFYVVAGLVYAVSALLLLRERRSGYRIYLLAFGATIVWALADGGLDPWALLPRLNVFAVILLVYWACWAKIGPRLHPSSRNTANWREVGVPAVALGAVFGVSALIFHDAETHPAMPDNIAASVEQSPLRQVNYEIDTSGDWRNYGNDAGGQRFSGLSQITPENVGQLKRAWVFNTGALQRPNEKPPRRFMFEATSIKVGNRLVLCTPHAQVIALDPATGKQVWRFDPHANVDANAFLACRGVSYDETKGATGLCAKRVLYATLTAKLYALDADTGALCPNFGNKGQVDLTVGLGAVKLGFYFVSSPPSVVRGKAVLGGWVLDNYERGEPSGVVRAYDTATGKLAWAYDMGRPDRQTLPPPGDHYTRGTPNVWAPISADPTLGLVYLPTGNETPDFFGGGRQKSSEQLASSILAVDADTGKLRWSFQTVHHDVWDFDVPGQPTLTDVPVSGGRTVPAVLVGTKHGEMFVLDRRSGRPLKSVIERPAPQGAVAGDFLSPTQPHSSMPSMAPAPLQEADMWGASPLDQLYCRMLFRKSRYNGIFTPPGTTPAILFPSSVGIYEWGGVSVDPRRGIYYVNTSYAAVMNQLVPRGTGEKAGQKGGQTSTDLGGPMKGTPYVAHSTLFASFLGIPCQQPPWGHMTAVDIAKGKVLWRKPLGTARDNGPLGIPSHMPITTGVPNLGGSVVTASGLIFIAASADSTFRALDASTGKELWRDYLPAGGQATPTVYSVNGKQYVVLSAGGHDGASSTLSDAVIAYALP